MKNQKTSNGNWLLYIYLLVPVLSSIISTVHLYDFVSLANNKLMALALAFTFELGSIVSFITLGPNVLNKIKKGYILTIFMLLFVLQAIGNVYAGFDFVRHQLLIDPTWLTSFMEMSMGMLDVTMAKLAISMLIGLPIPIISLILLKSAVDQIYTSDDELEFKSHDYSTPEVTLPKVTHPAEKPIDVVVIEKEDIMDVKIPEVTKEPIIDIPIEEPVKTETVLESLNEPTLEIVTEIPTVESTEIPQSEVESAIYNKVGDPPAAVKMSEEFLRKLRLIKKIR